MEEEKQIVNNHKVDAVKDNFKPPIMTEMDFEIAEEIIERFGLDYKEFQNHIFYNGEILDDKFYWTKEVVEFIKRCTT